MFSRIIKTTFLSLTFILSSYSAALSSTDSNRPQTGQQSKETDTPVQQAQKKSADAPRQIIPDQFPKFAVPGLEEQMNLLREMFFLHYTTTVSIATLWDGWLPMATLWATVPPQTQTLYSPTQWRTTLGNRRIDAEGYVSTHQHTGLAHAEGWPFPLWQQFGGIGWHFSLTDLPYGTPEFGMYPTKLIDNWKLSGLHSADINNQIGWKLVLDAPTATLTTPPFDINAAIFPFITLEWQANGLNEAISPYMEWATAAQPQFDTKRRMYFSPHSSPTVMGRTLIPVSKLASWAGRITQLRFCFSGKPQASIIVKAVFTTADSRHNINNSAYLQGCDDYIRWTGDLTFLRENIQRMRRAMHYMMQEFQTRKNNCVLTPWVGHDGRSGLEIDPNGKKTIHPGRGIGNNYWDLLPFGGKDALATIYYYDAVLRMASIEEQIKNHPEWNILIDETSFDPNDLRTHAKNVKQQAGKLFWNVKTGRFVAAIDADGKSHDYGITFLNLEAIYYHFATDEQARSILDWISGKRTVTNDTSKGADIYHWRFAPRATTLRNLDYYTSVWTAPEILPWGGQVQDGGAVLGFSYHDIMARLMAYNPDNAWQRLHDILGWFKEVQAAGGYRQYYSVAGRGTLQGAGTSGGLGMDQEFVESVLVPQVMLYGFMGFSPRLDGFELCPRLPRQWPQLTITDINYHTLLLDITAKTTIIKITVRKGADVPTKVFLPQGRWKIRSLDASGKQVAEPAMVIINSKNKSVVLSFNTGETIELIRSN